jgi:hypothetical protein
MLYARPNRELYSTHVRNRYRAGQGVLQVALFLDAIRLPDGLVMLASIVADRGIVAVPCFSLKQERWATYVVSSGGGGQTLDVGPTVRGTIDQDWEAGAEVFLEVASRSSLEAAEKSVT